MRRCPASVDRTEHETVVCQRNEGHATSTDPLEAWHLGFADFVPVYKWWDPTSGARGLGDVLSPPVPTSRAEVVTPRRLRA